MELDGADVVVARNPIMKKGPKETGVWLWDMSFSIPIEPTVAAAKMLQVLYGQSGVLVFPQSHLGFLDLTAWQGPVCRAVLDA